MSNLKKILTIQDERKLKLDIDNAHSKIRSWYDNQIATHKAALPEEEFQIARKALMAFMKKATLAANQEDPVILQYWKETYWFLLPWRVTLWYSVNKKK